MFCPKIRPNLKLLGNMLVVVALRSALWFEISVATVLKVENFLQKRMTFSLVGAILSNFLRSSRFVPPGRMSQIVAKLECWNFSSSDEFSL